MQQLIVMLERLTVFVICAQALLHFRPNEVYEKYLRFLVDLLILLQLLLPFSGLLGGMKDFSPEQELQQFQIRMEAAMEEGRVSVEE